MSGGDWFEEAVSDDEDEQADDGSEQPDGRSEQADGGDERSAAGDEPADENGDALPADADGASAGNDDPAADDETHAESDASADADCAPTADGDAPAGDDDGGVPAADADGAHAVDDSTPAGDDGDSDHSGREDVYAGPREADDETVAEQLDGPDDEDPELFEQGFADALDDVDIPDPAGSGPGNGGDPSLGEGFAGAGSGAGGGSYGAGGGSFGVGGQSDEFGGDEAYDSDIPRIDLGIEGLDAMIQGGVPERTLMVAIGSAGTGKTTFGLQFLHHALENGDNAVFVTLEESRERVVRSATEKGFAFDQYVEDGQLAVVDLDPVEMASSLQTIGGELPRLIEAFGAERLVLDSVSLLEMMYDDRARRRNEIYDFTTHLKDAGVTTMLTSEASEDSPYASRHGIVEYLTDAVFVLQYVRPSDFRETRLAVEIQKIRDANHSRETKPYEITGDGIDVYRQANLF